MVRDYNIHFAVNKPTIKTILLQQLIHRRGCPADKKFKVSITKKLVVKLNV